MRSQLTLTTILCALVLLAMAPAASAQEAAPGAVITDDTVWRQQDVDIEGNLTIASGASLTLEGTNLRVGGLLHVEEGGRLDLLPSSGRPSTITTYPGGTFWIRVDGEMSAIGAPGAEISGLWGSGLHSGMPGNDGGLQVHGSAEVADVRIHDAAAGVIVGHGAFLSLRGSTVEDLGEAGLMVHGELEMADTTVGGHEINIIGKDTCEVRIASSRFEHAGAEQIVINGCRADIRGSVVSGGSVGLVANHATHLNVSDTRIEGYSVDGLGSYAGPSPDGSGMLRPTVRLHNMTMAPGVGAQRGADLVDLQLAEFHNVRIEGHQSHGIRAQLTPLDIQDSTIASNGGLGIQLAGGHFVQDPLAAGNVFTGPKGANGQGALSHVVIAKFYAGYDTDHGWHSAGGDLQIRLQDQDGHPVEPMRNSPFEDGAVELWYDAYGADGASPVGPVTYMATHAAWSGARTGDVGPLQDTIFLEVSGAAKGSWPVVQVVSAAMVLLGVGIVALRPLTRTGLVQRLFRGRARDR